MRLPVGNRRNQLDGQLADGVRTDDNGRAYLSNLGADGRVEVNPPNFAAKRRRGTSSQRCLPRGAPATPCRDRSTQRRLQPVPQARVVAQKVTSS